MSATGIDRGECAKVLGCYEQKRAHYAEEAQSAAQCLARLGNWRLAMFSLALVPLGAGLLLDGPLRWSIGIALVPLLALVSLVTRSAAADAARRDAELARAWYDDGLLRLRGEHAGHGDPGTTFRDDQHPYASDLDLFGTGSLYERLARTRTARGATALAHMLLAPPPDVQQIHAAQAAVQELRPRLAFREQLSRVAGEATRATDGTKVRAWFDLPVTPIRPWHRASWVVTSMVSTLTIAGWWFGPLPGWVAVVALLLQWLALRPHRAFIVQELTQAERAGQELSLLRRLIRTVAAVSFAASRLRTAKARLSSVGRTPDQILGALERRATTIESLANPFFVPFALLWGLPAHLAFAVQRWRSAYAEDCRAWADAVADVEALASLASYAYEVPDACVPTVVDTTLHLRASDLCHPLLHADCVPNDIDLSSAAAWVVSGSNMSGKSTLLRTVGVSVVLAQAGAPVRASSFSCSPMRVGASLHVQDALQDGISRFQAELLRLRAIYDLCTAGPTLFLIDEMLAGTNSHDRRVGANAVVRALLDRQAIGLLTTHDLALTRLDDPRLKNVHFSDHFEGDKLVFDYRMREGVVTHSNALALMKVIGLPVPPETASRTTDGRADKNAL